MISQSCDYTFTNIKTLSIMEMLKNNKEFEHIVKIAPSDIINLALNILNVIVEEHDNDVVTNDEDIELFKSLFDDNKKFANYSALTFAISRANNDELNEKLLTICENKELTNLINSMVGD